MEKGLTCCQCFSFCLICCHYCFFCWNEKVIFLKISFMLSCESSTLRENLISRVSEKSRNSILAKSRNSGSQFKIYKSLVWSDQDLWFWQKRCKIVRKFDFIQAQLDPILSDFHKIGLFWTVIKISRSGFQIKSSSWSIFATLLHIHLFKSENFLPYCKFIPCG